jgi:hypothetical protein
VEIFRAVFADEYKKHLRVVKEKPFDDVVKYISENLGGRDREL